MTRDISYRKKIEESLELQRQELAEKNAQLLVANNELESFSYSVSHDLRAPLRTIDGFSHALLEDYECKLDQEAKNHLRRIRAATVRMGDLIDDRLALARLSRASMRFSNLDISSIVTSIVGALRKAEPARVVELQTIEGLKATADAGLLRIALENLLGNAWKFTSKKSSARIEFGQTECKGSTAFFVRDDGAGFDPAYASRLLGPFQRLHGMTEFEGTGIGLATVQRIIHRHNGHIWAESAVGHGATFYFTLNDTAFSGGATMSNRSILLVEDSPDDAALTIRALKKNQIVNELVLVQDGVEALDYLFGQGSFAGRDTTHMPQVILLDLKLPKLDGLGVLRRLRNDERTRMLPVVILTSSNEEQDRISGYGLGANSYVRKPVNFDAFVNAVAQLGLYWLVLNETPPRRN